MVIFPIELAICHSLGSKIPDTTERLQFLPQETGVPQAGNCSFLGRELEFPKRETTREL